MLMNFMLYPGDCLIALRSMSADSVDSVVTDPPYGLSFMGKRWDYDVPKTEIWAECLRVLKPGGHLLAFAGTRTQHRMAVRIEDAGFDIRDMIAWLYGSGFPKSLDVSKAVDKAAGAVREKIRIDASEVRNPKATGGGRDGTIGATRPWIEQAMLAGFHEKDSDRAVTADAQAWQGWGTALKPAMEPITVARKPFPGTVAQNVLAHGTGALNIDECRVGLSEGDDPRLGGKGVWTTTKPRGTVASSPLGRWPANVMHDGSAEVVSLFPESKGQQGDVRGTEQSRTGGVGTHCYGEYGPVATARRGDSGSAARFFYCAKTSKRDRDEGLARKSEPRANHHPTVKPTELMRYLCRLVTPPGGVVLDPFMGSGSTGKAAMLEGFSFVGCEMSDDYLELARARIEAMTTP